MPQGEVAPLPPLPPAEQLSVRRFERYDAYLGELPKRNRPTSVYTTACNQLEWGLAIGNKDQDTGTELLTTAYRSFTAISERDEFDFGKFPYSKSRLMLAWEPVFWHRQRRERPDAEAMTRTYQALGSIMTEVVGCGLSIKNRHELFAEYIALGAFARRLDPEFFPCVASLREQGNKGEPLANHTMYVAWYGDKEELHKLPIRISADRGKDDLTQSRSPVSPKVKVIAVLPQIKSMVESNLPDRVRIRRRTLPPQHHDGVIFEVAMELMAREVAGEELEAPEIAILGAIAQSFVNTALTFKKNQDPKRQAKTARGLTHNPMAKQLRNYLN